MKNPTVCKSSGRTMSVLKSLLVLERADLKLISNGVKLQHRCKMIRQFIVRHGITWAPEGKRRGRPKSTWRCTVDKERQEVGWQIWDKVQTIVANVI